MTRAAFILLALAWPVLCQQPQAPEERDAGSDTQKRRRGYFGSGRDDPEPENLHAVLIGYFGPDDPDHPVGGTVWQGVTLAIDEANAAGGYKGLPFRLAQGWAANRWADGVDKVVRMAYLERVWGIIGGIDGATTLLAQQVVAKARVTLIDPASTGDGVNAANVAWVFSCVPGDSKIVAVAGKALIEEAGASFALLSATDHDSRAITGELKLFLERNKAAPARHIEFQSGARETEALAAQIAASDVKAAVILAGPRESARIVRGLRQRRENLLIFGGPAMGRHSFRKEAGPAAEGVRFPMLVERSQASAAFAAKFAARYGFEPDYAAMHAYDAARLLIAAIHKAGLNRVRILDAVEDLSPWAGASGTIEWNAIGRNSREPKLSIVGRNSHDRAPD